MTLRGRLIVGVTLMLAALAVAGTVIALRHRAQLIDQLDRQLAAIAPNAEGLAARPGGAGPPGFTNIYVGVIDDTGRLDTLLAPLTDPNLVPAHTSLAAPGLAATAPTVSGDAGHVRSLTTETADGRLIVLALPTAAAEKSFRALLVTQAVAGAAVVAVLALVVWWVQRLGLRPIREMTLAADAIIAGDTARRVQAADGATEAGRLGRALNLMIDANQQSETRLRRFVADASHELRTPLTTLRGYTALYEGGGLGQPDTLADAMRRISAEANRMSTLVDDLLLLAELDEQPQLHHQPVAIDQVLADIAADARAVQPGRIIHVDAPAGLTVTADPQRLTQAITALTTNALRYTPPETSIELRAFRNGRSVRIDVVDHGPGISPEHQLQLFERFYRADNSRARSAGGNGLGLAITASIIDAHHGHHSVTTTPGGGATFHLELPTHPAA